MSVLIEFVSATVHTENLRSVGVKVMSLFLLHKKVTSELTNFSVSAMRAFRMRGLAFFICFYDFAMHRVSSTSGKKWVPSSYTLCDVDTFLGRAQGKTTMSI